MKNLQNELTQWFDSYYSSFLVESDESRKNMEIKRDHSYRVAEISSMLAGKLGFDDEEIMLAWFIGLVHDIGRFRQLIEYGTFHDEKSIDHADLSASILMESGVVGKWFIGKEEIVVNAVKNHNNFRIEEQVMGKDLLFSQLLRDADKLDILNVITDYYSHRNAEPNHTLTWEMPKGVAVSKAVGKEVLAGNQVSKKNVESEIDIKIMQLSWVYDMNFRPSVEYLLNRRYLEMIYNSLSKSDLVIEIYRKIKMFAENRLMAVAAK